MSREMLVSLVCQNQIMAMVQNTVKPVLSGHSKIDKTKILMTNGSLRKVESILQYYWPALSDNWSWKPIFCLFESGRFTQVLLYAK